MGNQEPQILVAHLHRRRPVHPRHDASPPKPSRTPKGEPQKTNQTRPVVLLLMFQRDDECEVTLSDEDREEESRGRRGNDGCRCSPVLGVAVRS